jgi:transcriptional regulator with XRE-family HTH domain
MKFGRKVMNVRLDRGLTQQELAKLCGITPGGLSRIESESNSPSAQTLRKLAHALLVPMEYLLDEKWPYPYEPPAHPRDAVLARGQKPSARIQAELTLEEKAFLDAVRKLPKAKREVLFALPTLPLQAVVLIHRAVTRASAEEHGEGDGR